MKPSCKRISKAIGGALLLALCLPGSAKDMVSPLLPPLRPTPPTPPEVLAEAARDLLDFLPDTVATYGQDGRITAEWLQASLTPDLAKNIYEDQVPDSMGLRQQCREVVLERITHVLALQSAVAEKVPVSEKEIDAVVAHTKELYGEDGLRRTFLRDGKSLEVFRGELKEKIMVHKWMWTQRQGAPAIPASAVKTYYDQNREVFFPEGKPVPEGLSHIFLPAGDARSRAAARIEAEDLYRQLKSGASFHYLAKDHSRGPTGFEGGKLDLFLTAQLPPLVKKAAAALKENEVSGVLESASGFHLIKGGRLLPRTDKQTFDTVRFQIQYKLEMEKRDAYLEEVLQKLREKLQVKLSIPDPEK